MLVMMFALLPIKLTRSSSSSPSSSSQAEIGLDVANACLVDKDLFASELVIRAERGGVRMLEIPVRVLEKRPPSIGLTRRVPNVLKNLARLFIAIRIKG